MTPEPTEVWRFHSHVYFDHRRAERIAEAAAFRERIARAFPGTDHLEVTSFHPEPAGPHPCGSFEVAFTRAVFADYLAWLMFTRPEYFDVLVHPLTRSQVLDHGARALWLGKPHDLDRALLEAADAKGRGPASHGDGTDRRA